MSRSLLTGNGQARPGMKGEKVFSGSTLSQNRHGQAFGLARVTQMVCLILFILVTSRSPVGSFRQDNKINKISIQKTSSNLVNLENHVDPVKESLGGRTVTFSDG